MIERGQTAVVTGAANGIGLAMARRFLDSGLRVVLADRDSDALDVAVSQLGDGALGVPTDVADAASVVALAARVAEVFGDVHVLCNNAGVIGPGRSWETSAASGRGSLSVNLDGVVNGLRSFVPAMLAHGAPCHVVNTASGAGLFVAPSFSAYCVSKAAVVALSESLAAEIALVPSARAAGPCAVPREHRRATCTAPRWPVTPTHRPTRPPHSAGRPRRRPSAPTRPTRNWSSTRCGPRWPAVTSTSCRSRRRCATRRSLDWAPSMLRCTAPCHSTVVPDRRCSTTSPASTGATPQRALATARRRPALLLRPSGRHDRGRTRRAGRLHRGAPHPRPPHRPPRRRRQGRARRRPERRR